MTTVEPDNLNPTPPPPPAAPEPEASPFTSRKNPIIAAILSLFPGVGNLYNGLYMRGLAFFLICTSMIILTATQEPLFGLGIAFFWIFNMVDAYRQATLINYGYGQDLGIDEPPKLASAGQGGMMVGIILFLIGGIALLEQFDVRIDLDWLIDLWPVFLMAIGAWLIFDTVRDKMKAKEEDEAIEL